MPCWPVSYRDGTYQVTDGDGTLYPITMARLPVEVFNSGWYATGLQTGLPPFYLLELRSDGPPEEEAVWYLSDELDFVANAPRHFNQGQAAKVVAGLSPLLRDIHGETLCAPQPAVAASSHAFDGINQTFAREMIGFVVETALSPPDVVMAQQLESVSAHYTADGTRLSASLLRHSLDVAAPGQSGNPVMLASPFDATLLDVQEHFQPGAGPISQVFRFRDPVGQMTLYLLFQQDGASALYVPAMNTVFAAREGLSGIEVMTTLLSHYACHTERAVRMHTDEGQQRMQADEVAQPAEIAAVAVPERPPAEAPASAGTDEPAVAMPSDEQPSPAATGVTPHPNWWKRLLGLGNP